MTREPPAKSPRATLKLIVLSTSFIVLPNLAFALEYEYEWRQYEAEHVFINIWTPEDNTCIPINATQTLGASANDRDCARYRYRESQSDPWSDWTAWYTYYDDVTSGQTSDDFHIWWSATEGTLADMYGTVATYQAPDYLDGSGIRNVTVTATADDYNRGDDTFGYGDDPNSDSLTLRIWQVTLSIQQTGTESENYDALPVPEEVGDTQLGFITPNTDAESAYYCANTQIKGTIPSGLGITSLFYFVQHKKGYASHEEGSPPDWYYDSGPDLDWTFDFGPSCSYVDGNSRHPDDGPDSREVIARDAPGWLAGVDNNSHIGGAYPWTGKYFDRRFKIHICWAGTGGWYPPRVSTDDVWRCLYRLEVDQPTSTWKVASPPEHIP